MTIYEWKITNLGDRQYGYIWIAENGTDEFGTVYKIYVDPDNLDAWVGKASADNSASNVIASMEAEEDSNRYRRIVFYWRKLGSPVIDRKAPGYEAPWFPWLEDGFVEEPQFFEDAPNRSEALEETINA